MIPSIKMTNAANSAKIPLRVNLDNNMVITAMTIVASQMLRSVAKYNQRSLVLKHTFDIPPPKRADCSSPHYAYQQQTIDMPNKYPKNKNWKSQTKNSMQ